MLAPAALVEKEAAAVAAIDALMSASIINSKKADWRLVAAAQAMRRGDYDDEFDAAGAMGKTVGQHREVANWVDKLEQLAQRAAPTNSDGAHAPSLLVEPAWVAQHVPIIQQLDARPLVLSPDKQHGKRILSALSSTPGGSMRETSATVDYTLPPADGERESASKRRGDRHRRREERKIRSLDFSGKSHQQHATAHAPSVSAPLASMSARLPPSSRSALRRSAYRTWLTSCCSSRRMATSAGSDQTRDFLVRLFGWIHFHSIRRARRAIDWCVSIVSLPT